MRTIFTILVALICGFVALVFGGSNDQPVTVNFLLFTLDMNLSHLIALSFGLGLVLGVALVAIKLISKSISARLKQAKVEKLQQEVTSLRAEPARDKL